MARRAITTTGLSRQVHTLYDKGYNEGPIGWDKRGTAQRSGGHHVVDWNYNTVPSVHNTFHQAVDSYTNRDPYGYTGMEVDGIWPRRPNAPGGPTYHGGNAT